MDWIQRGNLPEGEIELFGTKNCPCMGATCKGRCSVWGICSLYFQDGKCRGFGACLFYFD